MQNPWIPAKGNLVNWVNGPPKNTGIITEVMDHSIKVKFDSKLTMPFAWPSDVLRRQLFKTGDKIQVLPNNEVGIVLDVIRTLPVAIYEISLATGNPKITESSLRPLIIKDPVQLLKQGEIHDARNTNLRITAKRLLFDYQYNDFSSLSNSKVEIKPHQVAVLHRVATSYPFRFLLADEVGLGKTVEAGMIIKELKARGLADRVLIIAPSGLVGQWQKEMRSKFGMVFSRFNRETVTYLKTEHPNENVWDLKDKNNVITSHDFASLDEERRKVIAQADWDLVIFDEAHHARRHLDNERALKWSETQLYKLAELLARLDTGGTSGLLFLTATPMQLHQFELYSLVELLDPALFSDYFNFEENRQASKGLNLSVNNIRNWEGLANNQKQRTVSEVSEYLGKPTSEISASLETNIGRSKIEDELFSCHKLSEVLIRNRKAKIGGFMPRHAGIIPVRMSEEERLAYDAVRDYASEGYTYSKKTGNNTLGFVMTTFQKINSSSSYAVRESLMRRIKKLQDRLPIDNNLNGMEEDDIEEKNISEVLGDTLGMGGYNPVQQEIEALADVVRLLDLIKTDSKAAELTNKLAELYTKDDNVKVLVFTQFKDTQDYLKSRIPKSWTVNIYNGGLKPLEKDSVVDAFRDGTGPQIMISTEAGGEGRNFQFCHIMINYDLPWNPMKVEQRIGRLDRIGQKSPVIILNFKLIGTIEERVLEVLDKRIRIFEETIGGLDPILGEVENEIKNILLGASQKAELAFNRLGQDLERRVSEARQAEQQMADLIMDSKSLRKDEVDYLLNHRGNLDNKNMQCFVFSVLKQLEVSVKIDPKMPEVFMIKYYDTFLSTFPDFKKEELPWRVTFDPSTAMEQESIDFLAFGHPLVEALVSYVQSENYLASTSYLVIKTKDQPPVKGWFFTYVLEFGGVTQKRELFSIFVDEFGKPDDELSAWLLERCYQIKREDEEGPRNLSCNDVFEKALEYADQRVLDQLTLRGGELSAINDEKLDQKKVKVEQIYNHKKKAAEAKLAAVQTTLNNISASDDPEVRKIIPVWVDKLEKAMKFLKRIEEDKISSIKDIENGREVGGKYDILTASCVEILPSDFSQSVGENNDDQS